MQLSFYAIKLIIITIIIAMYFLRNCIGYFLYLDKDMG